MSDQVKPDKRPWIVCPECDGRGIVLCESTPITPPFIWQQYTTTCTTCNGYGYVRQSPPLEDMEVA